MVLLEDAHHVLVAYAGHRHQWSRDLGNLEDAVHQEAVLILEPHPRFNLPFIADSVSTAYNELLPTLRSSRQVKDAGITRSVSHVDNVVPTSTAEGQQDVGLRKIFH